VISHQNGQFVVLPSLDPSKCPALYNHPSAIALQADRRDYGLPICRSIVSLPANCPRPDGPAAKRIAIGPGAVRVEAT